MSNNLYPGIHRIRTILNTKASIWKNRTPGPTPWDNYRGDFGARDRPPSLCHVLKTSLVILRATYLVVNMGVESLSISLQVGHSRWDRPIADPCKVKGAIADFLVLHMKVINRFRKSIRISLVGSLVYYVWVSSFPNFFKRFSLLGNLN